MLRGRVPQVGDDNEYMRWLPVGPATILALQGDLLVEYDMATSAPIGLVTRVPDACSLHLLRADGAPAEQEDGSDVATVRVLEADGESGPLPGGVCRAGVSFASHERLGCTAQHICLPR